MTSLPAPAFRRARPLLRLAPLLRVALAVVALALATPAARAEPSPSTFITALAQMPDDPALYGDWRVVEFIDLAALRRVGGLPEGLDFDRLDSLPAQTREQVTRLLQRIVVTSELHQALMVGPGGWRETLGFDFLELEWFANPGHPKNRLLLFGGAAIPRDKGLGSLALAGLEPQERDGITVWAKGEDYASDREAVDASFPFWGWHGASVRIFRGERALVGARSWETLDLALAVERGEAVSLAMLPRFRLAAEAAAEAAHSDGPILQGFMLDAAFGKTLAGGRTNPEGLPPYSLVAFVEREDAGGHQLLLILTYDDVRTAEAAAERLAEILLLDRGLRLGRQFPTLEISPSVYSSDDGAAAVVRIATPPEPAAAGDGRMPGRSRLLEHFYRQVLTLANFRFLAVRE